MPGQLPHLLRSGTNGGKDSRPRENNKLMYLMNLPAVRHLVGNTVVVVAVGLDIAWRSQAHCKKVGMIEVDILEVGTLEVGNLEVGILEVGTLEVGILEVGILEVGILEVGILEMGILEVGLVDC